MTDFLDNYGLASKMLGYHLTEVVRLIEAWLVIYLILKNSDFVCRILTEVISHAWSLNIQRNF